MGTVEVGEELTGGSVERIFVSVRLRPPNAKEIYRNDVSEWECINDDTILYKNVCLSASERCMYPTAYTFDRVFRSNCSTREVYEKGAKDVAISVLSGMNSTVFAYGQTSSGKTYTMSGVTEYALADIYEYIGKHPEREFVLKFSAMEIYNESVRDLLSMDNTPLRLLDDPERGTIVEKLTEEILTDWGHVIQLLAVCEAQRQIGETSLNEMSSRSHQIIRLTIESSSRDSSGRGSTSSLAAAVNFVDLAGSERASQSLSAGTRLKEGCHINRSLLTLGTVIRKLSKGRGGHIPFRDSKLTRILQTSLGGNARTAIICTMSPARSHVEQSRNTLLFASCAKEVTTNAQVNVIMSEKALVKYLQSRVERLENELRSPQPAFIPSNISLLLREKDIQIEKLEGDVNDLILQRDIAQSKIRDLLQVLADNRSVPHVGYEDYPNLRFRRLPDNPNPMQESSVSADPCSSVVNTQAYSNGHRETSSEDHRTKLFVQNSTPPRFSASSSSISACYSFNGWEEIEKHSDASEDLCKDVRCIETAEAVESSSVCSEENSGFPEVHEFINGFEEVVDVESPPTPAEYHNSRAATPKNGGDISRDKRIVHTKQQEEQTPAPLRQASTETPPLTHGVDKGSFMDSSLKLTRSRSCDSSIFDSASSLFMTMGLSENTSSIRTKRECTHFDRKLSSRKDPQYSPGNDLDIPDPKLWITESVNSSEDIQAKAEVQTEQACTENQLKLTELKVNEHPKTNVKDVGLDPIEHAVQAHSSWTAEFKVLQQEIIQLWHACKVSLIHRTYFFMLFEGDPSDSIYLEVERRRLKFLKNKFSQGNKAIVNGQLVTLASSAKILHEERKFLSRLMKKKFSAQERGGLFLKWGISINTKHRRLQLAHCLWTKPEDGDHVVDSAFLIAKLIGFVESGEALSKEMFGLNFTSPQSTRTYGFKRSITSIYDLIDSVR